MNEADRIEVYKLIINGHASCFACVFCWKSSDGPQAYCQKAPPVLLSEDSERGMWPLVKKTDWCGEFYPIAALPISS